MNCMWKLPFVSRVHSAFASSVTNTLCQDWRGHVNVPFVMMVIVLALMCNQRVCDVLVVAELWGNKTLVDKRLEGGE